MMGDWSADGTRLLFLDFNNEQLGVMPAEGIDVGRFGLGGRMLDRIASCSSRCAGSMVHVPTTAYIEYPPLRSDH